MNEKEKEPLIATAFFPRGKDSSYLRIEREDGTIWWYENSEPGWLLVGMTQADKLEREFWKEPTRDEIEVRLASEDHNLLEQIYTTLQQEGNDDADRGSRTT